MTVELFNFSKRFNSTKVPTLGSGTSFTNVNLKDECSIFDPVITFAVSSFSVPTIAPTLYNYVSIPKFQRYYFIDDWVYVNGVWEAHLSIDVLGTYKTSIGNMSTLVERSASSYDGNVMDSFYPRTVNSSISSVSMASAFYGVAPSNGTFVLGIVGAPTILNDTNYNNLGSVYYYAINMLGMRDLCSWLYSDNLWNSLNITDISNGLFKSMFDPMQYIVSCIYFPYDVFNFSSGTATTVKIGYWDTGVQAFGVAIYAMTSDITAQIPDHPQISRGAYLNYNPYTKATAYLPGVGSVPVDTSFRVGGNYIRARYLIDVHTGMADVKVAICSLAELNNSTDGNVFYSTSFMFGVPIQISQALVQTISSNGYSLGDITNLFGNFVKTKIMPDLISSIGGTSVDYSGGYPSISSCGSNGSMNIAINKATLIVEHFRITDEDLAEFGRPLMQVKTINTLSGYIKCIDAHVDLPITEKEKKQITEYMTSGFFYE